MGEAAALLQVSKATIYKLVADGTLPHCRVINSIRILGDALAKYARAGGAR